MASTRTIYVRPQDETWWESLEKYADEQQSSLSRVLAGLIRQFLMELDARDR
jgi:fumarate reductase subunit C